MNPRRTGEPAGDPALERLLRGADALAGTEGLGGELGIALPRTRAAVAAAGAGSPAAAGRVVGSVATTTAAPSGPVAAFITYPAPWGTVHVAASDRGIAAIELASTTESFVEILGARLRGAVVPDQPGLPPAWRATLDRARTELDEYFGGRRTSFDLPVDLRGVSAWDRQVLEAAAGLAFGEVTSYGRLARRVGKPRAARAVGGALGRNPIPIVIPCHRILAGDGNLGGYGGGHSGRAAMLDVKRSLLALEAVQLPAAVLVG